jgi:hypothetical protein
MSNKRGFKGDANRSKRREAAGGRDRRRNHGSADCNRGDNREVPAKIGTYPERSRRRSQKSRELDQGGAPQDSQKSSSGEMEMNQHQPKDKYQQEVDRNYAEFQKMLPTLLATQRDKYALMKDGKILGYYSTAEDAAVTAQTFIPDGIFSIQEVTDTSINLGFFTYAVPVDTIQP